MIYLLHNTLDHIMLLAVTDNVTLEQSWQTTTQFRKYICLFCTIVQKWILLSFSSYIKASS